MAAPATCNHCQRTMRPNKSKAADHPDAEAAYAGRGLCTSCYSHERRFGNLEGWMPGPQNSRPSHCIHCRKAMRAAHSLNDGRVEHSGAGYCTNCHKHRQDTPDELARLNHAKAALDAYLTARRNRLSRQHRHALAA